MPGTIRRDEPDPIDIGISTETLAFIILHARAYDMETPETDPDEGSNSADDRMIDVLEGGPDNPMGAELRAAITSLTVDRRAALVALAWVGRGDFDRSQWDEALSTAASRANGATARYLMGMPMLGDLLEQGADELGIDPTHDEQTGLHHPITEEPSEDDRD
jgi:hypothetical protein